MERFDLKTDRVSHDSPHLPLKPTHLQWDEETYFSKQISICSSKVDLEDEQVDLSRGSVIEP